MFAFIKKKHKREFDFLKVGFHGDRYLLDVVDAIIRDCECFIETGTNVGSTLAYVARNYTRIKCLSCEPDKRAFRHALVNTSALSNASVYHETSQQFIRRLEKKYQHLFDKNVLFWLDSHGYGFKWPLKDEIDFITTRFTAPYILIDDFKVPGLDCFGYDAYDGQECSFEYIQSALIPKPVYRLYYPAYTDRTSEHHPLRGWGLIEFGHAGEWNVPGALQGKIRHVAIHQQGGGGHEKNQKNIPAPTGRKRPEAVIR